MRAPHLTLAVAVSLLLATGCEDDDDGTGPVQTVAVRVVNASSGTAGTVNVTAGATDVATGLAFRGATTTCVNVPIGAQTFTFRSGTTTLATANATLAAGNKYTVILSGTGATPTATVLTDNPTAPATGNAAIRFVNATATAGDVHATPVGTTTLSAATILTGGANLAAGSATGFLTSPTTNNRFRLTAVNTPGTTRSDTGATAVTLPADRITTFVFVPAGTPAGPTFLQVNPCP